MAQLWSRIQQLAALTLAAMQPMIAHCYSIALGPEGGARGCGWAAASEELRRVSAGLKAARLQHGHASMTAAPSAEALMPSQQRAQPQPLRPNGGSRLLPKSLMHAREREGGCSCQPDPVSATAAPPGVAPPGRGSSEEGFVEGGDGEETRPPASRCFHIIGFDVMLDYRHGRSSEQ